MHFEKNKISIDWLRGRVSYVFMCLIFVLVFLRLTVVNVFAEGEAQLSDIATINFDSIINKSDGDKSLLNADPAETVYYGDTLLVNMNWTFKENIQIVKDQQYIFELPDDINFGDKENIPINDDNRGVRVGYCSILDNTVYVWYDEDEFLSNIPEFGKLSFSGSVVADDASNPQEGLKEIYFTDQTKLNINLLKRPVDSDLAIDKHISDAYGKPTDNVYDCTVKVTSTGTNENIYFYDEMYPGMALEEGPYLYTDSNLTQALDSSRYTIDTAVKGSRSIEISIDSLANNETVYVYYKLKVDEKMYTKASANQYIDDNNFIGYYPNHFEGRVPNLAGVKSNQVPEAKEDWADVYPLRASFNKWGYPEDPTLTKGELSWMFVLYGLDDSITSGYIKDILPDNVILDESSVKVAEVLNYYNELEGYVTIEQKIEEGKNVAYFKFSDELIDYLHRYKDRTGSILRISYHTKITEQAGEKATYNNKAEIYFNGSDTPDMITSSDQSFEKPDPLEKYGEYREEIAPNIEYLLHVNPAALDIDEGDDLILVDKMSASYDLIVSTLKINGETADKSMYSFDADSREITFYLKDGKTYVITYEARVNLVPGSQLTAENSINTATLYSPTKEHFTASKKIESMVFQSAASSSAYNNKGMLNVVKHDADDDSIILEGADFSLTRMTVDASGNATEDSSVAAVTKTTNANGEASFINLDRGVVYMLKEDKAPEGYVLDETPTFYTFAGTSMVTPSEVTFEGNTYTVKTAAADKMSYDAYVSNTLKTQSTPAPSNSNGTPDPVVPTNPTDPTTTNGGSANTTNNTNNDTTTTTTTTTDSSKDIVSTTNTTEETSKAQEDTSTTTTQKENALGSDKKNDSTQDTKKDVPNTSETKPSTTVNTSTNTTTPAPGASVPNTTPQTTNSSSRTVRTGDGLNSLIWIILLVSLVGIAILTVLIKYNNKKID